MKCNDEDRAIPAQSVILLACPTCWVAQTQRGFQPPQLDARPKAETQLLAVNPGSVLWYLHVR